MLGMKSSGKLMHRSVDFILPGVCLPLKISTYKLSLRIVNEHQRTKTFSPFPPTDVDRGQPSAARRVRCPLTLLTWTETR